MKRVTSVLVLSAAFVGLLSVPARSHVRTHQDRNDTSGPLDIKTAGVGHRGDTVKFAIELWQHPRDEAEWVETLGEGGVLHLYFDSDPDANTFFHGFVYVEEGKLVAELDRWRYDVISHGGDVELRVSDDRLRFVVDKDDARLRNRRLMGWTWNTRYSDDAECTDLCFDEAPDGDNWYAHRLRPRRT